jgi:AcrR family transcriptional regulator
VLDAAESLVAESGPGAVTTRAVAAAVGISNGALYHTFGSRAELLGQAWLRAARRFLAAQNALVDDALKTADDALKTADDAVVAAAEAPAVFAERYPQSATLLFAVRREELLAEEIPTTLASEINELQDELVDLMVRLSTAIWDRKDAKAVDVITTCIVDLPTAILLRRNRLDQPLAREHLRAAVRAVLKIGPPERRHR